MQSRKLGSPVAPVSASCLDVYDICQRNAFLVLLFCDREPVCERGGLPRYFMAVHGSRQHSDYDSMSGPRSSVFPWSPSKYSESADLLTKHKVTSHGDFFVSHLTHGLDFVGLCRTRCYFLFCLRG